ncbi:MAG: NAD(P)H-dependent oxidoreductase [Rhodocyclaceae bacterium]|nr:NAD(P)H-dependent oxidoreductase [Rhodocyclaceae bacterium]
MKILGISGSLRRNSYNRRLLQAADAMLGEAASVHIFDLAKLPFYDADLDGDAKPAPVRELLQAIASADGILFATPEYNYSVPGVLKNAIDWASRPAYTSVMRGKPSAIVSASPSTLGGVRAQVHLRDILSATLTPVFPSPDFLLASAHKAFDESGGLVDAASADFLQKYLQGYVAWAGAQAAGAQGGQR